MSDILAFPILPTQRTALTPSEVEQYVTRPAYNNDVKLQDRIETAETNIDARLIPVRNSSMPTAATAGQLWIKASESNQLYYCITTYTAGNGTTGHWVAIRDYTTLAAATAAQSTANTPPVTAGSAYPSAYTANWIFVRSTDGAAFHCNTTYTAALPTGERASKFTSMADLAARADIATVQGYVDDMSDDGLITPSEKLKLYREWVQIQANKAAMDVLATQLGITLESAYTTAVTKYTTLQSYLGSGILDLFADMAATTNLSTEGSNRSEWNTRWTDWYTANTGFSNKAATTLKANIDAGQSDETVTESEVRDYKVRWNYEVENYAQLTSLATTLSLLSDGAWTVYAAAYSALNTYLNTTLNIFNNSTWPFILSSSGSSAAEWVTKWQTYTDAEREISIKTSSTMADQIDALANDGVIAKNGEKNLAISAWRIIYGSVGSDGEYALAVNRATQLIAAGNTGLSTPKTTLTNAYTQLHDYLDGLSDFFNPAVDTVVVNATWDSTWRTYYTAFAALEAQSSDIADTNVGLVSGLVNDESITAGKEKQELIERLDQIKLEKTALLNKAAVGVTASTTLFVAAYAALETYLYGLFTNEAGFYIKETGAININRTIWKQKFDNYLTAREDLETAIISNNVNNLTVDSAAIPNMATDGTITVDEKETALSYWRTIVGATWTAATDSGYVEVGEHTALKTQATNLGVAGGTITAFDGAFGTLWSFLVSGTKLGQTAAEQLDVFTDMLATKTLSPAEKAFWTNSSWSLYYAQRDTIVQAITTALNVSLSGKLDKAGGTMSGTLNMGTNSITGVVAATPTSGGANAATAGQIYDSVPINGASNAVAGRQKMTGNLEIEKTNPDLILDDSSGTGTAAVSFQRSGSQTAQAIVEAGENFVTIKATDANIGLALGTSDTVSASNKRMIRLKDPVNPQDACTFGKQSPTGSVMMFAAAAAPTGWLICNGAAVSRSTYAALFDVISTTYGAGNTTTTFNVPNLKGRIPVGYDSSQTEFDALGETGGEKTHALVDAEIQAHHHTIDVSGTTGVTSQDHTHLYIDNTITDTSLSKGVAGGPTFGGEDFQKTSGGQSQSHTHGFAISGAITGNVGSGTAHNNLQPYLTLNYIIKT